MNDLLHGASEAELRALSAQSANAAESAPACGEADAVLQLQAQAALELLSGLAANPGRLLELDPALRLRLVQAAAEVGHPDARSKREFARALRRRKRVQQRAQDEQVLAQSRIRSDRLAAVFATPAPSARRPPLPPGSDIDLLLSGEAEDAAASSADAPAARTVSRERSCYVCKRAFTQLHFFYDSLCPPCGDLNFAKREQSADLGGRVALVTGARVKIGYQASIMLLRAGASVIATTRFARDASARYAAEPDFECWRERLQIFGLDLRHTPSVEAFARHLCATAPRLDYILNNACQTVRRPTGFYAHLLNAERRALSELPASARPLLAAYEAMRQHPLPEVGTGRGLAAPQDPAAPAVAMGLHDPAGLSQLALTEDDLRQGTHLFPRGQLDADLQQVDLRARNSWRLPLAEVSAAELLEVQLVNAVAPFVLNARLKPLMLRVPSRDKHIVNVSAMEGQFYRSFKTDKHPHTNMAKAALNMMTRTSAADYARDGIHMNSVDTGWVTDEDPAEIAARKTREQGFHPPLDIVDGAARICDPIFSGVSTGQHVFGLFLKDYAPTDW